jgi:hypothetical protein
MLNEAEKIKKEEQQIIGIIPVVDMKNFVLLMLADLASKSKIHYFNNNIKIACLSTNYKEIIEDIMYEGNGWGIEFASLIDIYSYYEKQQDWEQELGCTIQEVLEELNKELRYDFEYDNIEIDFKEEEIDSIKNNYDEETLEVMDHFTNLMSSPIFDRRYKLKQKEMDRSVNRRMDKAHDFLINDLRRNGVKCPEKYISE